MLKLCAAAYEDGYAVYTEGDRMFMLRPPYRGQASIEVGCEALGRAITLHGFKQTNEQFEGISELIAHLKAKWSEASPLPPREAVDRRASESLRRAEPDTLERLLIKIETEMMPRKRWDKLQRILQDILANENLRKCDDLYRKCCRLLEECTTQQNAPKQLLDKDITEFKRMPAIFQKVAAAAEPAKKRRFSLPVGSRIAA